MKDQKILLVGCGKLGGSLIEGITKVDVPLRNVIVVEPDTKSVHDKFNVRTLEGFTQELVDFAPDIIIFAVKPQVIGSIIDDYKIFTGHSLFISVIAGKTTAYFEKCLGKDAAIVRTMPNLPVAVNEGVCYYNEKARTTCSKADFPKIIFESIGKVFYLDEKSRYDESALDAVTAISGSGPGYFFYFIECHPELASEPLDSGKFHCFIDALKEAAVKLGLVRSDAIALANQTAKGSLLLLQKSGKPASELRKMVTSPGGTTEAALQILRKDGKKSMQPEYMHELMVEATAAARNRSQELSE